MMLIQIVDVLAGYHVYLAVPILIEILEGLKLATLLVGDVAKVFLYDVYVHIQLFSFFLNNGSRVALLMVNSMRPKA